MPHYAAKKKEDTQAKIEKQVQDKAVLLTKDGFSNIVPEEMRKKAEAKPPNEFRTYSEIILMDFVSNKKERGELTDYLNSIGTDVPTILSIIKTGGIYERIYKEYWKNFSKIAMGDAVEKFYHGDAEQASAHLTAIKKNETHIKAAGITEKELYDVAKESQYRKKMTARQWKGFIELAARNGFDKAALEAQ